MSVQMVILGGRISLIFSCKMHQKGGLRFSLQRQGVHEINKKSRTLSPFHLPLPCGVFGKLCSDQAGNSKRQQDVEIFRLLLRFWYHYGLFTLGGAGDKCNICRVLLFLCIDSQNNMKAEEIPNLVWMLETLKMCSALLCWAVLESARAWIWGFWSGKWGSELLVSCPAPRAGNWEWDGGKGTRGQRRSALFVTSEQPKKEKK